MRRFLIVVCALLVIFNKKVWAQSQTVNNGQSTTSVSFSGCVYNWVNDTPGIGLPASGTGDIGSFTAVNNGSAAVTAKITATPATAVNAYIPNSNNPGVVSVINTSSNAVTATIDVGNNPTAVSVSPDGSRVYIANTSSNNVSVINSSTNVVVATVTVGNFPSCISVSYDGSKVFVGNVNDGTVSVISTASNTLIATIPGFTQPAALVASSTGNLLYVINGSSAISVVNTVSNTIIKNITVGFSPWKIAVSPDGTTVYVTNLSNNSVSVINAASNTVITAIPVDMTPEGITVSPDGKLLYVGCFGSSTVDVINTSTNTVIKQITASSPQGLSVTPDGKTLYVVNNTSPGTVSAYSTATSTLAATVKTTNYPSSFGNFIGGMACARIQFTITVNPASAATATVTAGPVTGAITACAGTASASPQIQQFTVSGSNLTDNITATAPTNFEVSLSQAAGYGPSVTIPQTGGTVANAIVYVRSSASATTGNITGNVMLTSETATQNVAVSGIVNALPTISPVGPQLFNNGNTTTAINFSGTGNTFTWTNDTPGIGLAASGTGNIAPFTALNTGASPITANITVNLTNIPYAYVTNFLTGSISVVDILTNTVIKSIAVGSNPGALSETPDGKFIYVANSGSNTVSVISTATNAIVATINVGKKPDGVEVSPDGSSIYVANALSNTVSVISTSNNTVTSTFIVGGYPEGIVFSPNGAIAYVTNVYGNSVSVVNTTNGNIITTISVGESPQGITISPDGGLVYVACTLVNSVSVINTSTNAVIAQIGMPEPGTLALSPDNKWLYVTNPSVNTISIVSVQTNAVIKTIPVGINPNSVAPTVDGTKLYVANFGSNNISVIEIATDATVATIPMSGPDSINNFIALNTNCSGQPITFTITVNPTPIITVGQPTGTITACQGTASASPNIQQFTVSGNNLSADITLAAPVDFEISLNSASGYASNLTLAQTAGAVNNTVIYVRSAASAPAQPLSEVVTIASTGANSQFEQVSGTVNPGTNCRPC
jgi:YVTN family beta-propeller protein